MYSKIKIAGHPVHPMLIAFPVAFYTAALACFIAYSSNHAPFYFKAAVLANAAGVVMALVAAIPGFIDWLNISSNTRAKKTGMFHMICNVIALILFALNLWMQFGKRNELNPTLGMAIPLTAAGFLITLAAGFLGWTLVQDHYVGVNIDQSDLTPERRERQATTTVTGTSEMWQAAKDEKRQ